MEPNPNFSKNALEDFYLVLRAKNGDQLAFSEIMKRYNNAVHKLVLKFTGNIDDADDITSLAFAKAFQFLDRYSPNYTFTTWLYKIAANLAIDHLKKKRLELVSLAVLADGQEDNVYETFVVSKEPNPEELAIRDQEKKNLKLIIQKLPCKSKTLINLRFYEGLSIKEIAEIFQRPIGTIKVQLSRAMKDLVLLKERTFINP